MGNVGKITQSGDEARANGARGNMHRYQLTTVPFETAIELQGLIVAAAKNQDTSPAALAQLARAWSELEGRKRIIKGKGDPKPVEVKRRGKAKRTEVAVPIRVEPPLPATGTEGK